MEETEVKQKLTKKEYFKKYYETNREKFLKGREKIQCPLCKKYSAIYNMNRHQKTNKCKNIFLEINPKETGMTHLNKLIDKLLEERFSKLLTGNKNL